MTTSVESALMAVKTGILEYAAATVRKWNKLKKIEIYNIFSFYDCLGIHFLYYITICQPVKIAIKAKPILKSPKNDTTN